ncbi:hypothetical protein PGTUg99_026065 [Puccinia graminis f. sp. tritici]|uniref:DH domain-containing protein n=1 Tax=Puccinia graminis f. sp. tritici TaxID=56615 RepID=A0A5B0QMR7_PUCGR|nr:hypothetical protein PGTUg99_026065 [Puccinia graminis f. sp. tritici]
MDRRSTSPKPTQLAFKHHQSLTKPRPISYNPSRTLSTTTATQTTQSTTTQTNMNKTPPSLQALNQLPPLPILTNLNQPPPTTQSTLIDVVVEGMGGGNEPGEGWQVPPELVFFLRSLGERLDPFSPTDTRSTTASGGPAGHTKSLTAALNHATLRPTTDQPAINALFTELVVTERAYLKRIAALNQSYAIPLKTFSKSSQTKIIDKYEATSMFGKIEAVVSVNSSLLNTLEICLKIIEQQPGTGQWADLLSNELLNIQRAYRDYLAAYDSIKETEQKLLKKSEGFRQFCERTKEAMYDDGMGRVGLRELLMEPVQRITRYILIFEQMLKKMSSNDPARPGLLACIATCNRLAVCELDDHLIKAATMWGLHRSIDHFPAILVKPGRYFIDSIDVLDIIPDTPSPTVLHCTLFLFNDTIVIAKKPANGQLTGRTLAGLDDIDRLVGAMKKAKTNNSSLNSVVSGGTDFFAKSLGGGHSTPTKLKKGSMRFKGLVDVHDVIVANEPGQTGIGSTSEVSFDLYLGRPPQDVSDRWTDRPFRHYVVCPPPAPALSGHEKSLSLSAHPSSSSTSHHQPPNPTSHSLSHKSLQNLNSQQSYAAALAERDRFLDNLRKSQALVKAADDRSTVMRTKFVNEIDNKAVIDSFWNLYDKQSYLTEQRKHRVVLQLVGTDAVDPLQFVTESIDPAPPLMIIRAHFNDPDDPDCRVHVRRKPNHVFPSLNASIDKAEEDIVVQTECLSGLIVRIIQAYGIADIPPRGSHIFSASNQQSQPQYNGPLNPPSPLRGFRTKSGTLLPENGVNSALPHRLFGTHHGNKEGLSRTRSLRSGHAKSASNGVTASQPGTPSVALREIQPTATRSPGGPVWYRNPSKGNGISSRLQELAAEPNSALYDDLPRLREEGNRQRSASPARSTLKGKARAGSLFEEEGEEEDPRWAGAESESQSSSVSGLSSYDDDDDYNNQQLQQQMVPRSVETLAGSRQRTLVGPRQLVPPSDRSSSNNTIMARARSEPPAKEAAKPATLGPLRLPEPIALRADHSSGSRNPSGSSLGKRSRSVDHTHPHHPNPHRHRSSSSSSSSSCGSGRSGIEDDDHQGPKKIIKTTQPLNVRKSISDKKPAPDHQLHNKKKKKNEDEDEDEKSAAVPKKIPSGAGGGEMNHHQHQDEDEEDTLSCVDNHLLLGGDRAASEGKVVGREDQDEEDEDIGTSELFREVKGRLKAMKQQLKKLKSEVDLQVGPSSSSVPIGGSVHDQHDNGGGSRSVNGSIPRSPRKLHLSEVAKSTDPSSLLKPGSNNSKAKGAKGLHKGEANNPLTELVSQLESALGTVDRKVRLVQKTQADGVRVVKNRFMEEINEKKKELERLKNQCELMTTRGRMTEELFERLEKENTHLYEAFNEELDKMFNDIQLPVSQSIDLLVQDLKKIAAERGHLSTLLGYEDEILSVLCNGGIIEIGY